MPQRAAVLGTIAGPILRPPVMFTQLAAPPPAPELPPEPPPAATGWISGHVVDGNGEPVGGAILHLSGPTGAQSHRIADDGEFHFEVSEGAWSVEAGLLEGRDEWRSITTTARIVPGATATLAIEILLNSAAHTVHAGLKENLGVGWEVQRDDGPLQAGDVLIEVNGKLLSEMQPESARALLRERMGESIRAVVLRANEAGTLAEVPVVLEAR